MSGAARPRPRRGDGRFPAAVAALAGEMVTDPALRAACAAPARGTALEAEVRAAERVARQALERLGGAPVPLPEALVRHLTERAWLTLGAWLEGTARICLHAPHPSRPGCLPVLVALWKPDVVTCGECEHLLLLPRTAPEAGTCDLCGARPGDPGISRVTVQLGPVLVLAGCCAACRPG